MISASLALLITALYISSAETISTILTNGTGSRLTFPDISVTSAPRSIAILAIAYPIFPVELLDKNLTGSNFSLVGPAVTVSLIPAISLSLAIVLKM